MLSIASEPDVLEISLTSLTSDRRHKPGTLALREIRRYQKSTDLLLLNVRCALLVCLSLFTPFFFCLPLPCCRPFAKLDLPYYRDPKSCSPISTCRSGCFTMAIASHTSATGEPWSVHDASIWGYESRCYTGGEEDMEVTLVAQAFCFLAWSFLFSVKISFAAGILPPQGYSQWSST